MPGVKGTVKDVGTGDPIAGMLVILNAESDNIKAPTDERGKYKIKNLVAGGHYTIDVMDCVPDDAKYKRGTAQFDAYADDGDATNYVIRDIALEKKE